MKFNSITISQPVSHVLVVSLNRPDAANALTTMMALELKDIFTDYGDARAIILSGVGRNFCAGADLKERKGMDEAAWKSQHEAFRNARDAVLDCPLPVIAAINGAAFAGGLELALASDFIYAADNAKFALTEAALGIMPGMGATITLPRAVGERRAKEILFSAKPFSAQEAYEWGLANKLCAPESLINEAIKTAAAIAENAPLAIKAIKKSLRDANFKDELSHYNTLLKTMDRHEGINAWGEKRKPVFKGE